jgi:NDP-sugar pyrophosphorylase family protein
MPDVKDAIILCGGAGSRLRAVMGDTPKSLADVAGRPVLEILLRQLQRHGLRRIILATGFKAGSIQSYFGEAFLGMELTYSAELSPLGTGGALRHAANRVESAFSLVMNGDSYTDVDLGTFIDFHRRSKADISVVVVPADERSDSGSVRIDSSGKVLQFQEKEAPLSGLYMNAGVYVLPRQALYEIPADVRVSLEREMFPQWICRGLSVMAFLHSGRCVDIGTPARYQTAQTLLADVEAEVSRAKEVVSE